MSKTIFAILKMIYKTVLREIIAKAVDNPDSQMDDVLMAVLDRIFYYNG